MYNVIFGRQAHRDEYGSTESEIKFYRCDTHNDVISTIRMCALKQLQDEESDRIKSRSRWSSYGDWGFTVLYNGYAVHVDWDIADNVCNNTDGPTEEEWEESERVTADVPDLDIYNLVQKVKNGFAAYAEEVARFQKVEMALGEHYRLEEQRMKVEKQERARLEELLKKYPDMING